jgi:hypothetical protein
VNISWGGVLLRMMFAVALVLLTFNPTGHSFLHWLTAPPADITPLKTVAGLALLIGWIGCLRTAFVSLGVVGLVLGAALLAALVWLLVSVGWVSVGSTNSFVWVVLLILGVLLGVGLSWSLLRARATGQVEVR